MTLITWYAVLQASRRWSSWSGGLPCHAARACHLQMRCMKACNVSEVQDRMRHSNVTQESDAAGTAPASSSPQALQ